MKKEKIKSLAVILCATAILASIASGTNAFFTADERAHNVITTGNVDIELVEMMENNEGELVEFENQNGVMPGMDVSKIVTVKNTGEQPAYVRIVVDKTISLADGSTENVDTSLVTYDINTEKWTDRDGYYYYNEPLAAGLETEPLFTAVSFSEEMDNLYQSSQIEINIQAQATQVANNGATVFEAAGWPAE